MKVVVFNKPGHVTPTIRVPIEKSLEQTVEELSAQGISYLIVDAGDLPQDRAFRNGWVVQGQSIVHDMDKCRAIHRDFIRSMRKPRFEALDAIWMRCTAAGDVAGASAAEAKRQLLRDATSFQAISSATT